ncbi:MAG: hypothetical protein HDR43_03270 [Mycoplasma sp.]|nr:hypothetical protein [Mycoplasma sp.]
MTFIQDFFNNNPVIAGVIFFFIIALLTLFCIWIFLVIRRKNKQKRKNKQDNNINNQQSNIVKKIDVEHFEYQLSIARNSNLVIKNLKNNELNNLPTKEIFLNILNDKNSKLYLPYDNVEILLNKEQNKFTTSKNISDHNLFIFNAFLRFMENSNMNWSKSKFK